MSRSVPTLTPPQEVLQSYLNDLLRDVSLETDMPELTDSESKATKVADEELQHQALDIPCIDEKSLFTTVPILEASSAEKIGAESEVLPPSIILQDQVIAKPPVPDIPAAARVEESLDWAEAPFECLLFEVAGLTLAVPLITLGSIYLLNEEHLTPIFGQPNWFMGILSCPVGNLKVLESARWLMAERYDAQFRQGLRYVLSIQGYDWGLAVHQVNRSVRIDPKNVKWRAQRQQRPWLAGTVVEHMCALVDVRALAELIASGSRSMQATRGQIND